MDAVNFSLTMCFSAMYVWNRREKAAEGIYWSYTVSVTHRSLHCTPVLLPSSKRFMCPNKAKQSCNYWRVRLL